MNKQAKQNGQRFTKKQIEKIMAKNETVVDVPDSMVQALKTLGSVFDDYLDEYETYAFHRGYELGYAAAVKDLRG